MANVRKGKIKMKKIILITGSLIFTAIILRAQQEDFLNLTSPYLGQKLPAIALENISVDGVVHSREPDSLESTIDSIFKDWKYPNTPGGVIAVVHDSKILFMKGYGCADLENAALMTPSTKLYLASISKQFTGYCIAKLILNGKLSLDDNVRTYIPEMRLITHTIKIRDLVYQKSGLRDLYGLLPLTGSRLNDWFSNDDVLRILYKQHDLNFMPGDEWEYSNTNYLLLAEIVKRITGESIKRWAEKHIFVPLQMLNTGYVDSIETLIPFRANSYHQNRDGSFSNDPFLDVTVGHTGLYSTAEDMSKWLLHIRNLSRREDSLLTLMLKSDTLNDGNEIANYSFGFFKSSNKAPQYWHRGSLFGFKSIISYYPKQDFGLVIMGNVQTFDRRKYAREVTRLFYPEVVPDGPIAQPDSVFEGAIKKKRFMIDSGTLKKHAGNYVVDPMTVYRVEIQSDALSIWEVSTSRIVNLIPIAKNQFRDVEGTLLVNFSEDNQGIVNKMIYQKASTKVEGKKAKVLSHSQEQEIVGDYYNDELEITIKVAKTSKGLEAYNLLLGRIPFYPAEVDQFRCDHDFFSFITLSRDSKRRIEGFLLNGFAVRNMKFMKNGNNETGEKT
jgi:CubicO group peptidase (beta-lactamase class C family)